jgi:hypothetical protein
MKKAVSLLILAAMILTLSAVVNRHPKRRRSPLPTPPRPGRYRSPRSPGGEAPNSVQEVNWPTAPITLIVPALPRRHRHQARVYAKYLERSGSFHCCAEREHTAAYQSLNPRRMTATPSCSPLPPSSFRMVSAPLVIPLTKAASGHRFLHFRHKRSVCRADGKYKAFEDFINDVQANPGVVQLGIAAATYFHVFPAAMEKELGIDTI